MHTGQIIGSQDIDKSSKKSYQLTQFIAFRKKTNKNSRLSIIPWIITNRNHSAPTSYLKMDRSNEHHQPTKTMSRYSDYRNWMARLRRFFLSKTTSLQHHEHFMEGVEPTQSALVCGVWVSLRRYSGRVLVKGELYEAYSKDIPMYLGDKIQVIGKQCGRLIVKPFFPKP